jgi:hypothetical protein
MGLPLDYDFCKQLEALDRYPEFIARLAIIRLVLRNLADLAPTFQVVQDRLLNGKIRRAVKPAQLLQGHLFPNKAALLCPRQEEIVDL